MRQQCTAITKTGLRCKNRQHGYLCARHSPYYQKPKTRKVNYKAYMRSKEWRAKRQQYIDSPYTTNDCYCCGRKYQRGFNLHHLTYKRLGNERLDDMKMVCAPCHEAIHDLAKITRNIALATHKLRIAHGLPVKGPIRTRMR